MKTPNVTARIIPNVTLASVIEIGPIKSPEMIKSNRILTTVVKDGKKNSPDTKEISCHKASSVAMPRTLETSHENLKINPHHL
jgi:hypothetical protein